MKNFILAFLVLSVLPAVAQRRPDPRVTACQEEIKYRESSAKEAQKSFDYRARIGRQNKIAIDRYVQNLQKQYEELVEKATFAAIRDYELSGQQFRELDYKWKVSQVLPEIYRKTNLHADLLKKNGVSPMITLRTDTSDPLDNTYWWENHIRIQAFKTIAYSTSNVYLMIALVAEVEDSSGSSDKYVRGLKIIDLDTGKEVNKAEGSLTNWNGESSKSSLVNPFPAWEKGAREELAKELEYVKTGLNECRQIIRDATKTIKDL